MISPGAVTLGFYTSILLCLLVYGLHRSYLVYVYMKGGHRAPAAPASADVSAGQPGLGWHPLVTVQLPIDNEMYVAERLIRAVGQFEYPADRLEIQVLDDSTDETPEIAERAVERLLASGLNATYIHRRSREGFKAGALAHGLTVARGEFIAIFDADFVPAPDFLARAPLADRPLHADSCGQPDVRMDGTRPRAARQQPAHSAARGVYRPAVSANVHSAGAALTPKAVEMGRYNYR